MLGALFQRSSTKSSVPIKEASFQDKLDKLFTLHQRLVTLTHHEHSLVRIALQSLVVNGILLIISC